MIIPDVNLLVYATDRQSRFHDKARHWLTSVLEGNDVIGFPWAVVLGYLRVSTNRRAIPNPLLPEVALTAIKQWLSRGSSILIEPGPRHLEILSDLLTHLGTGGNIVQDAHLAALAIENRAEICSFDGDFNRFPGVRWRNPLL